MKRPTWATIIGALAIVFGLFGILSGAQEMYSTEIVKSQKEMMKAFEGFAQNAENSSKNRESINNAKKAFEKMQEQFALPDWYEHWEIAIGASSIIVAALYFLSGIFLIMIKPYAVIIFNVAIGVSIIWAGVQIMIASQSSNNYLSMQIPFHVAGIIIDLLLFTVVYFGKKDAFKPIEETE